MYKKIYVTFLLALPGNNWVSLVVMWELYAFPSIPDTDVACFSEPCELKQEEGHLFDEALTLLPHKFAPPSS